MDIILARLLEEDMIREAERIMEEVNRDPFVKNAVIPEPNIEEMMEYIRQQEAGETLPDFSTFATIICDNCKSNDWYCTGYCDMLKKAKEMPFEKIRKAYARHDGDVVKIVRYIRRAK